MLRTNFNKSDIRMTIIVEILCFRKLLQKALSPQLEELRNDCVEPDIMKEQLQNVYRVQRRMFIIDEILRFRELLQ